MNKHDEAGIIFENGYKKGATDVFEAIDKILTTDGHLAFCSVRNFAELKKKYTEDERD